MTNSDSESLEAAALSECRLILGGMEAVVGKRSQALKKKAVVGDVASMEFNLDTEIGSLTVFALSAAVVKSNLETVDADVLMAALLAGAAFARGFHRDWDTARPFVEKMLRVRAGGKKGREQSQREEKEAKQRRLSMLQSLVNDLVTKNTNLSERSFANHVAKRASRDGIYLSNDEEIRPDTIRHYLKTGQLVRPKRK